MGSSALKFRGLRISEKSFTGSLRRIVRSRCAGGVDSLHVLHCLDELSAKDDQVVSQVIVDGLLIN